MVGAETERQWAYSGLHLVLSALVGSLDPGEQQELEPKAEDLLDSLTEEANAYDVARRLQALIGRVSSPVLLSVDDAHLLDARSQEVLGFVARRLRSVPLAMILAADRSGDVAPFNGLATVGLDELSPSEAVRLVQRAGGSQMSPRVAAAIAGRVGGNPGALLDVVSRIPAEQRTGQMPLERHLPRSPVLEAPLREELGRLEAAQRHALLVVAANEDRKLAPVLNALREHGEGLLAWLMNEHLTEIDGEFGLQRPVVPSVVWHAASLAERSRAHEALAAAYDGRDSEQQLWHLAQLRHDEDDERAAELRRAADHALARGELDRALAFAREAVRLTARDSERVERLLLAGRLALFAGSFQEVIGVAQERFRLDTSVQQRADLALLEARARNMLDGDVAAGLITRHVEELADVDPNRAARMNLFAVFAYAARMEQAEADRFLTVAERYAGHFDDATHLMYRRASAWLASISGDLSRALDLLDDTAGPEDIFAEAEQRIYRATVLLRAERFDTARRLLRGIIRDVRLRESPLLMSAAHAALTVLEAKAGHLVTARDAGNEGRRLGAGGIWRAILPASMVRTYALLGEEELAWACHRDAVERARRHSDGWTTALLQFEAGGLLLAQGRFDEAIATLERARRFALEHVDPSLLPVEPDYIEACVRAGDLRRAEIALTEFEERVMKTPTVWAQHALARCRALVAEGDESIGLFKVALETVTEALSPVELAKTTLCLGERLRRLRQRLEAAGWLRRAKVLAQECAAVALVDLAEQELRASGRYSSGRGDTWDAHVEGLTPAERRVADLVAAGKRNREIAADLFVSVRTVEAHLSRMYRKIGVRSRSELASLVTSTNDDHLDDESAPGEPAS